MSPSSYKNIPVVQQNHISQACTFFNVIETRTPAKASSTALTTRSNNQINIKIIHHVPPPRKNKHFRLGIIKSCDVCSTTQSFTWLRSRNGQRVCNACGKYERRTGRERPKILWRKKDKAGVGNSSKEHKSKHVLVAGGSSTEERNESCMLGERSSENVVGDNPSCSAMAISLTAAKVYATFGIVNHGETVKEFDMSFYSDVGFPRLSPLLEPDKSSEMQGGDATRVCRHCGLRSRRWGVISNGLRVCEACAVYWRRRGYMRPTHVIKLFKIRKMCHYGKNKGS